MKVKFQSGTEKKTKTLDMPLTRENMKEAMVILHTCAHVIREEVDRRFANIGLWPDLQSVFCIAFDPTACGDEGIEPHGALQRVAKHFNVQCDAFIESWRALVTKKEAVLEGLLSEGKQKRGGGTVTRLDIAIKDVWPLVFKAVVVPGGSEHDTYQVGLVALETFLVLEATNAGVEQMGQ